MGTIDFQQPIVSTTKTNMKLFLIAAVLVASVFAEPESEAKADAKPWLAYSNLGYAGWPYAAGYAAYPATYGLGYNGYATGYAGAHLIGKREADSEAKPWLTYANYGYAGYPYAATYGAYAYPSVYNTAYAAPVATYAGAHLIGKREAEADSEAKPWLTYANYGYAGYPYAATYGAYAYPSVYNTAYAAPVATYAGAHLIGKREAEADSEAKPWLTYANYGYAGYPYAATYAAGAYAYPSVYSTAYAAPVATYAGAHLIGKRSAEADSWYGFSGYASPYATYGGYYGR